MAIPCAYSTKAGSLSNQVLDRNHPAPHLNLSPKLIAMFPRIHCYTEPRQQLWTRDVIARRSPFFFTHVKEAIAIIGVLAFLFGFWFGVSTHHAPRTSYPYYDTQKPVPPWSEPPPLGGKHKTGGDYK